MIASWMCFKQNRSKSYTNTISEHLILQAYAPVGISPSILVQSGRTKMTQSIAQSWGVECDSLRHCSTGFADKDRPPCLSMPGWSNWTSEVKWPHRLHEQSINCILTALNLAASQGWMLIFVLLFCQSEKLRKTNLINYRAVNSDNNKCRIFVIWRG